METMDAIAEAQSPEVFDVLSFIEDTAYPTETVVVYTAVKEAEELLKVNRERLDSEANNEKFDPAELDERIANLTEIVKGSALVFELRGMPPGIVQDTFQIKDETTDEEIRDMENDLVARTIANVKNAAGKRDPRLWDREGVAKLRRFLKEGEFAKLTAGVTNVNFNAAVFDQATDAGFLGRGADLAS